MGRRASGEQILLWTVPVLAIIWIAAFVTFPGFVHPIPPTAGPDEVAAFYRDPANLPRIRYSMIVFNWFGIGLIPFLALIVMQIRRMAHSTPILAYCYFGCITGGPVLFFLADLFWLLAAYRPERPPALTQMYNDFAWVTFTTQVGFIFAQNVFLALAIWLDRQADPVFPRWLAMFNVAVAIAVAPAAFSAIVMTGPLAWDGFVSFWVKNIAIGAWIVVMFFAMRTALAREARAEGSVR